MQYWKTALKPVQECVAACSAGQLLFTQCPQGCAWLMDNCQYFLCGGRMRSKHVHPKRVLWYTGDRKKHNSLRQT